MQGSKLAGARVRGAPRNLAKFQKLGARRAPTNFNSVTDKWSWLYLQ